MKKSLLTAKFPDANTIELEVYYHLGGYNYFTSAEEPRGYYLGMQPLQQGEGTQSFRLFSGKRFLLEGAKRKNGRRLAELWAKVEPKAEAMARAFEEQDYRKIVELAGQADGRVQSAGEADNE